MSYINSAGSPQWSPNSKRLVLAVAVSLLLAGLYSVRALLPPFIIAVVLAYLVEPVVNLISRRTRLPRIVAIALVYILIILALVSIPVSAITPIAAQVNTFLSNVPRYLQQLGELLQQPINISWIEIPTDQLPIEQVYGSLSNNLLTIIQTLGSQSLSLFGSVASATLSTVGWTVLVLFLSFYMVKDHDKIFSAVIRTVPESYRTDYYHLSQEMSLTWNAFLRGQLLLCVAVGLIVFVVAVAIGLPNALLLALIASFAEFLPTIGPVLAAVPAALIGLFQSNASWIGANMTPFWFMVLILGLYAVIFQMENYLLVPRIIGRHLNLHPLVVILGALAGASIAGVLGILLAAPLLATARLFVKYVYFKLTDQPPFPDLLSVEAQDEEE